MLLKDETIENIGEGIKLIQSESLFKFGTDATLLASFAKVKKGGNVLDLCTGSGVIPLLMYEKNKDCKFYALEITEKASDMAKRTMELNGLSDRIIVTKGDVLNAKEIYKGMQFDLITCNPPYMDKGCGIVNPDSDKAIARHEILCTLEDVLSSSSQLLKPGGYFAMVHRPRRLTDIMCLMRKYKLEPKRLEIVSFNKKKKPDFVLVEGLKDGGKYLETEIRFIEES